MRKPILLMIHLRSLVGMCYEGAIFISRYMLTYKKGKRGLSELLETTCEGCTYKMGKVCIRYVAEWKVLFFIFNDGK